MNRDIAEMSLGLGGRTFISGTNKTYGPFFAVQCVTDCVFSQIDPVPTGDTFTTVSIPAGFPIYGETRSFTLTSGKVMAYKAV